MYRSLAAGLAAGLAASLATGNPIAPVLVVPIGLMLVHSFTRRSSSLEDDQWRARREATEHSRNMDLEMTAAYERTRDPAIRAKIAARPLYDPHVHISVADMIRDNHLPPGWAPKGGWPPGVTPENAVYPAHVRSTLKGPQR